MTYYFDSFLSKKDLKVGASYLFKDGRVGMYMGMSDTDSYVFYITCRALLIGLSEINLAHEKVQSLYLKGITEKLMQESCDISCLQLFRTMPKLYAMLSFIPVYEEVNKWWTKSMMQVPNLPRLAESKKDLKVPFVSAKDLVPGELYYTGSLWRALYLYLGRDSKKNFCWYFVGNEYYLTRNDLTEYKSNMDRTKTNKKCKRLKDAIYDDNAHLYREAIDLIKSAWKADLTGLDLG